MLVRAGSLKDDEASKPFRALRVTAVRFGLELAALPKVRHDAKEARLREHSITYLAKLWQLTVDRAGERGNVAVRQRLQVDWAGTKRRLGTYGRNAKRQLMPG